MATTYSAILPILHECSLFKSVPLVLSDGISVRSMKAEHLGAIIKRYPKLSQLLSPNLKCILMVGNYRDASQSKIQSAYTTIGFSLNVFSKSGAIGCGSCYIVRHTRVHTVSSVIEADRQGAISQEKFKLLESAKPNDIKSVYESTSAAVVSDPKLEISLRRYNAALKRGTIEDKIIDLAVCLESIFSSQTEISFKFSLFNAVLYEEDFAKRKEVFGLLKKLYRERSNLVHGNTELDYAWCHENWERVIAIAKVSLLKKIEFLSENRIEQWQSYLQDMILGG